MGYVFGSKKLYAVKVLLSADGTGRGQWYWARPSEDKDRPFYVEADNVVMLMLDDTQRSTGEVRKEDNRITSIADVTFATVDIARKACFELTTQYKDSLQMVKIVDLTPHHPTYPEHQVVWFQEFKKGKGKR